MDPAHVAAQVVEAHASDEFFRPVPVNRFDDVADEGVAARGVDFPDHGPVLLRHLVQAGAAFEEAGPGSAYEAVAEPQAEQAEDGDAGMGQDEERPLRPGCGHEGIHWDGHADPADDVPRGVVLVRVAFEAGGLSDQRAHEPEKRLSLHVTDGRRLGASACESAQGLGLPLVGRVFGPSRPKARDVPAQPESFLAQFVHLAGHVGGVDQGQTFAVRGLHVPVRDVDQIGIGRGGVAGGHVETALPGRPQPVGQILAEGRSGFGLRDHLYGTVDLAHVPEQGKAQQRGPKQGNSDRGSRGCHMALSEAPSTAGLRAFMSNRWRRSLRRW